ncbi:hypothetical protein MC5_07270 [Rickettsia australis str. Cutlack]|uniref:Nucleotidyltransferase substrate binding protein n=1 Tax=Rickettsia australis (strain Cutlack) TaxID=1105110 RepID=H8K8U1_RICAC|nr:hypothetical protein MC5_07270 [Rickettsia australis str. Cutlack]
MIKEAYSAEIINDEDLWIYMLTDHNMTSHTYDTKLADEIYSRIKNYVPELKKLLNIPKVNKELVNENQLQKEQGVH